MGGGPVEASSSGAAGMRASVRRAATRAWRGAWAARADFGGDTLAQSRPVKPDPTVNNEPRGGR